MKPAQPPSATNPPPDDRPGLPPPTIGMRGLFVLMTLFGVMMAVHITFGFIVAMGLGFAILTVLAHLAGASLGHRLRKIGDLPQPHDVPRPMQPEATSVTPATRLGLRYSLGTPIVISTAIGAVTGACAGGGLLAYLNREQGTLFTMIVGGAAFAVLGGIWTFLASSFLRVGLDAFLQARRNRPKSPDYGS